MKANCIHHGNALDYLPKLKENSFDVIIADPPYNIGKDFGNDSDKQSMDEYLEWTDEWIGECMRIIKPCSPVYVYGLPEILSHIAVRLPMDKQRWLVWHYTNKTVPTSTFWQRSHESILCLWKGAKPKINVDAVREEYTDGFLKGAAGKVRKETHCRYSTKGKKTIYAAHPKGALPRDVIKVPALAGGSGYVERWFYCKDCDKLCNPKSAEIHREHEIIKHPTQKPLELSRKLIAAATDVGGNVFIPFAGSGSECVSAKSMGVNFFATELNLDYAILANEWIQV